MTIELYIANHHPALAWDVDSLQQKLANILPDLLSSPGNDAPSRIPAGAEIEISLVDDPTIARIHKDFMNLDSPTDVITFGHGEIIVSLDTAHSAAQELGSSPAREALLYCIHGLLHLHGYDDLTPGAAETMHARQFALLENT